MAVANNKKGLQTLSWTFNVITLQRLIYSLVCLYRPTLVAYFSHSICTTCTLITYVICV